ncbi:MAG: ATP synthase subunit b [Syntrophus sp. SKADARSKE-3]|nr:ATP synthase subunit b [Syntrophus sp. SKADARSKE-3]
MKKVCSRQTAKSILLALAAVLLTAAAAFASSEGGAHHGPGMAEWKDFAWRMMNFTILVGFLWWFLAKKIKEFFSGRRVDIKTSLDEAEVAKEEANKKYKEYEAKLEKATIEIDGIVEMIKAQGMVEKEKIIEDAKKAAAKIEEDTKARMEQEFKGASQQLRQEAVQLSVQMAEEILKRSITAQDHDNMVRDYLDKVVIKH